MQCYRGWEMLDAMPDGWCIDNTAGSPLSGYEFITNRKSVINGQQRALLKINKSIIPFEETNISNTKAETIPIKKQVIDDNYVKTVNDLARKKFEQKMLKDILVDLTICEIEGWSKTEYIDELKTLINSIGKSNASY